MSHSHLKVFELHGPDCVVGEDLLPLELHLEEAVGDPRVGADVLGPVHVALTPAALLGRKVRQIESWQEVQVIINSGKYLLFEFGAHDNKVFLLLV